MNEIKAGLGGFGGIVLAAYIGSMILCLIYYVFTRSLEIY